MYSQNKYGAIKLKVDGRVFDSRKEAMRYSQLKILERSGEISELQMQVPFELVPSQREPDHIGARGGVKRGKVIEKSVVYYADFVYKDKQGKTVVEDTKSEITKKNKEYVIKRKLMLYRYGIRIKEV